MVHSRGAGFFPGSPRSLDHLTKGHNPWRDPTRRASNRGPIRFGLGTTELIIILVLVLIIFGAGKLPELGRTLGSGIRNFNKSIRGDGEEETPPAELPPGDPPAGEITDK